MNDMERFDITCPWCQIHIHVPFMRELEAKAIEEADLAEVTAKIELDSLKDWLDTVSLVGLIIWWLKRRR